MPGEKRQARKKGHKNRKHGRSARPGQKAGVLRNQLGRRDRKRRNILQSNGAAALERWEREGRV